MDFYIFEKFITLLIFVADFQYQVNVNRFVNFGGEPSRWKIVLRPYCVSFFGGLYPKDALRIPSVTYSVLFYVGYCTRT